MWSFRFLRTIKINRELQRLLPRITSIGPLPLVLFHYNSTMDLNMRAYVFGKSQTTIFISIMYGFPSRAFVKEHLAFSKVSAKSIPAAKRQTACKNISCTGGWPVKRSHFGSLQNLLEQLPGDFHFSVVTFSLNTWHFTVPRSLLTVNVSTSFTLTRRYQFSSITLKNVFRTIYCEHTTYTKFIKQRCLHHVSSLWHKFARVH